ncbi:MAG: hypothetical protein K940chlam5_01768 [Candidatus Anoxychlamydiales bacterium]|nr:hypothetical protein [Candidatus Anoxychlamydiales bacterium]
MAISPYKIFDASKFLDSEQKVVFHQSVGESIWSDSSFLQKTWGYLHLRSDFSLYPNNQYFVDRGKVYVEQNDSKKILPLFLKYIYRNPSLKQQVIEKFVTLVPFDKLLTMNKADFEFPLRYSLITILNESSFDFIAYRPLIFAITKIIKELPEEELFIGRIKQLVVELFSKIFHLAKIKNELKLSSKLFQAFILKHLNYIFSNDFSYNELKSSIRKKLNEMKHQYCIDSPKNRKEHDKFIEKVADLGICQGLTFSLISQDSHEPDPEKAYKRAVFLQPFQRIEHLFQLKNRQIGRKVVENSSDFFPTLSKVCKILNYKKADESVDLDSFLKDVASKEGISEGVYQLIGKKIAEERSDYRNADDELRKIIESAAVGGKNKKSLLKLLKLDEKKLLKYLSMDGIVHWLSDELSDIQSSSKYTKLNLTLHDMKDNSSGHSIFLSLDPIGFCDQNDVNFEDLKFRFRKFDFIEDMLIHLLFFMFKI